MYKLALVTGASAGLGRALCHALAKQGVALILVARRDNLLQELAEELPCSAMIHRCDLSSQSDRKTLIQLIHEQTPDLIINNAGFGLYGSTLSQSLSELEEMVKVNVQALMELTLEGARALKKVKKKGVIVNISSAAAFFPFPTFSVYAATKAFVNSFSEGVNAELQSEGIRVLAICPGQIDTDFRKRASKNWPQKKEPLAMTSEEAATLILAQIKKGHAISIIDWRYRFLVGLARLFPKQLVMRSVLQKSLKDRYSRCS